MSELILGTGWRQNSDYVWDFAGNCFKIEGNLENLLYVKMKRRNIRQIFIRENAIVPAT